MVHILSRLPVKTVFHCKAWLELISGPDFVELHFSRSKPSLIVHHSEMFKNLLKVVEFDGATDHRGLHYDERMRFDLTRLSKFPDADIVVDGSINGFLFLRDVNYKHETLFICNPVTLWSLVAVSGQYKVVRIFHERELDPINGSCLRIPSSECQVYTLGTGLWRGVGGISFGYNSNSTGLFLNGNLHWLVEALEGSELIYCFDLEKELFQQIPPPFPKRKLLGSLGRFRRFFMPV
ncbi:hypothetical protein RD792_011046 [Penstemon davidsonii]|uniref:F-box associated beta-propeller type 3 domain-containing protein n=1 Tax=Penstemon davidsonii TaxID=160366 RepID=A0ABR0D484_9LAMI|nr:hypothetical protein RD792_011046 [Penstemon davidsonii]